MSSGVTAALAEFALGTRAEDVPMAAVHAVRRALLDYAGVAAAGTAHPASRAMVEMLRRTGVGGECRLVGSAHRADPVNAALANGLAAHVFDWDDTLLPARIHLSATLFPPLLAVAESTGMAFEDIIPAFAVGFEIQARISRAIYPAIHLGRWHSTSVVAPPGTAAAVGRMLRLNEGQMAHAMGLAANAAAGLMSAFGTMSKAVNVGRAGAAGLQSAYMAGLGVQSHPDTVAAGGYLTAYDPVPRIASLLDGLGARWAVVENGFKPYPCGFVAHALIDAMRDMRSQAAGRTLASMRVRVAPEALQLMGNTAPTDALGAKFSLLYSAAVAWATGDVTPACYEGTALDDPQTRDAMDRIDVQAEPGVPQDSAWAEATFTDGNQASIHVPHARGTPERPLSDADLVAKFQAGRRSAGMDDGEALAASILAGHTMSATELMALIAA